MKINKKLHHLMLATAFVAFLPMGASTASAIMVAPQEQGQVKKAPQSRELTITVLPFEVKNIDKSMLEKMRNAIKEGALPETDTMGKEYSMMLMEQLTSTHGLSLVDRKDLDKTLSEMELSISGVIDPDTASRIGHLVGAKVIVTGRIFPVKRSLVFVSKIISVETGRVYGETITVPLNTSLNEAAVEMGVKIATTISNKQDSLQADISKEMSASERLKPLMAGYAGKNLPVISIQIEERHINSEEIDPSAETEIGMILQQLGFKVIDPLSSNEVPDIKIQGEAFSEFGMRKGNLVSSKGRIEIKVIQTSDGGLLLIDREVDAAVDLSTNIAGRAALAKAADTLSDRIVPALLKLAKDQ